MESLAKGAVQFSQRFTVRELQDRWHCLLYDPIISAEASAHMIAFERSASNLPSKFNRFGNSKESKTVYGKRKAGSVRSYYYALRKRICNEPFDSMDLSFLVAPGNGNYMGHEDEPLSQDCMSADPISDHFGLQGSNLDVLHHIFPKNPMNGVTASGGTAAASHAFHPGLQHPDEEHFHLGQDHMHKETPHPFGENLPFTGNSSEVKELVETKDLPGHCLFKSDDLVIEPSSTFDQIDHDPVNICSDFEGNQVFNSPLSECGASFHNLGFSSPLHGSPIWRTVEGISETSMPVDVGHREKDLHTGDKFELPDANDARNATQLGYYGHTDSKLKIEIPCDVLKSPIPSAEGYLAELSNSLLNFTNEEELLCMDVDGKDVIDKSYYDGLSSLLLNSPNDVSQDHIPRKTELETSAASEAYVTNPSIACPGELEDNKGSQCGDVHRAEDLGAQMLSSSSPSDSQFLGLGDEVICCTLNTEDPEIPCNDDFDPPNQFSSSSASFVTRQNLQEVNNPTSSTVNDILGGQRTHDRGLVMQRGGKNIAESHSSSKMLGSHAFTEIGLKHPIGSGVKFELPNSDYPHAASKGAGVSCCSSNKVNSVSLSKNVLRPAMLKEESKELSPTKHLCHNQTDSFTKRPSLGSESFKGYSQTNASSIKQEVDPQATIRDYQPTHAEVGLVDIPGAEPVENLPISDQEELPIESDDDVPHYSDIEAMVNAKLVALEWIGGTHLRFDLFLTVFVEIIPSQILDMDLDPEDQDLYSGEEGISQSTECT